MRVIKGIVLFCFSMVALSACFEAPEFSDTPKIIFKDIKFKEVGAASDYDTLILFLDFKDGNGDLGLSPLNEDDFEAPYNSEFYFLADGTGNTIPIISRVIQNYTVLNADSLPGKLVTSKTRLLPNYEDLPPYNPNSCLDYSFLTEVLVPFSSVDASYTIQDTVRLLNGKRYAKIQEAVLYQPNPNHYNIEIKFWLFDGATGDFVEYDWFEEYCITYDGRFTTSLNPFPTYIDRPIEGTLRYGMANTSFPAVFGNTPLKISARIRDRALNVSNTVYTEVFDLNKIRQ
jgi:hypothetical protein